MSWLHAMCVGIAKDEPIDPCRNVPSYLQIQMTCIKDDVQDL